MTDTDPLPRRTGTWWYAAWPCWLLLIFTGLALTRLLPPGVGRAIVAAPIFLTVPGALTLGGVLAMRRLQPVVFGCLAILLSVLWSAFASLALDFLHVLITAESTYWCLLLVCVVLAAVAQLRIRLGPSIGLDGDADQPGSSKSAGYAVAGLAAGAILLAGGTYSYEHGPHPVPVGYTRIAWTGAQVKGAISVGPSGITLPFQIAHQQPDSADFRLSAAWTGVGQRRSLATPVTIHVGPDKTMHGELTIPPPPGGCAYRIVVTLVALGQTHPQSWSINVDVRQRSRRQNACAS